MVDRLEHKKVDEDLFPGSYWQLDKYFSSFQIRGPQLVAYRPHVAPPALHVCFYNPEGFFPQTHTVLPASRVIIYSCSFHPSLSTPLQQQHFFFWPSWFLLSSLLVLSSILEFWVLCWIGTHTIQLFHSSFPSITILKVIYVYKEDKAAVRMGTGKGEEKGQYFCKSK